jgi:hypothetical protein
MSGKIAEDDRPKFPLGALVETWGAEQALQEAGESADTYLDRHAFGDWGDVDEHDAEENDFSVENNLRILSVYTLSTGVKIWIITEANRSRTTTLLPAEY